VPTLMSDLDLLLRRSEARMLSATSDLHPTVAAPIRDLVRNRGKSLRTRMLAAASGWRTNPETVIASSVVELIHIGTLLHDDIIDKATKRRGQPAATEAHGSDFAGVAGVCCMTIAAEMFSLMPGVQPDELDGTLNDLVDGERRDVERAFDVNASPADLIEIGRLKTGSLFALACALALRGSGSSRHRAAFRDFGSAFGAAYQVVDDCLAYASGTANKSVEVDAMNGIFGIPLVIAASSSGTIGRQVRDIALAESWTGSRHQTLVALVRESGSIEVALDYADRSIESAQESLLGCDLMEARTLAAFGADVYARARDEVV